MTKRSKGTPPGRGQESTREAPSGVDSLTGPRQAAGSRPESSEALHLFLSRYAVDLRREPREVLSEVATAFSRLPYENLTKIIKRDRAETPGEARREPGEVVRDHVTWGTGGTCFSLTFTLLHLLRSLGWKAEPILADRRYGENTHCALLVWLGGEPRLLDPGFLIVRPLFLIPSEETCVTTRFNRLKLRPRSGGAKVDLFTEQQDQEVYRLTFKTDPADPGEFFGAWDASFDWDMMRYPLLTRVHGGRQLYLQGRKLARRGHRSVERQEVTWESLVERIAAEFGIHRRVAARAIRILEQKGERGGGAPAP